MYFILLLGVFSIQKSDNNNELEKDEIFKSEMLAGFSHYINDIFNEVLEENLSLKDFIRTKTLFVKVWDTIRIDIRNQGNASNSIRVLNADDNLDIISPNWLNDANGNGFKLTTQLNKIKFTFKCIGDGEINIKFRGSDFRHFLDYDNRIPIKIAYEKIKVNKEMILEDKRLLWHDNAVGYSKKCYDGELITVEVEASKIYDYFPNLMNLCEDIKNDGLIINSVSNLKRFISDRSSGSDEQFDDLFMENYYLTKRYDKLNQEMGLFDENKILNNLDTDLLKNGQFKNLQMYFEGRVDIVNFGDETDIELVYSSGADNLRIPKWIVGGNGIVVESIKGSLDLIIRCIGDGEAKFTFRGMDVKDSEGNRFLVYIDFTNILIDDKPIIEERRLVSHNDSIVHVCDVKDGQFMSVHMEWEPFSKKSSVN